ncbi:MAG: hypothetical protein EXR08_00120 [Alphaproteobacteria bacterium]|nr:hypothetical protein [Alphaproteobacteria bacterium]
MNLTSASQRPHDEMETGLDLSAAAHLRPANEILSELDVTAAAGLNSLEAAQRLNQFGWNRLTEKPRRASWLLFVDQFKSYLIVVLMFAAVLAGIVGDFTDALVILFVILLNAFLGFQQEQRAEQSLSVLKKMLATSCRVRRGGVAMEIPADELVPGDIVLLDAGSRVPADGRLVQATTLEIDESLFTGESVPVTKTAEMVCDVKIPLAERANMAFMNT